MPVRHQGTFIDPFIENLEVENLIDPLVTESVHLLLYIFQSALL